MKTDFSLTTDKNGVKTSEMRYKPWGEVRSWWTSALATTPAYKLADYTFTGQYSYMDDLSTPATEGFGLMFYNARFYDPALGRFTSADTIIPGGVQGLDRYAYVNNSPVNYADPSGHKCVPEDECSGMSSIKNFNWKASVKNMFGVTLDGNWSSKAAEAMYTALLRFDLNFKGTLKTLIGGTTFYHYNKDKGTYGGATWLDGSAINFGFNNSETAPYQNVYHEVAHLINLRFNNFFTDTLDSSSVYTDDGEFVMGRRNGVYDRQTGLGYSSADVCDANWSGCSIDAEQHPGNISSKTEWGTVGNTADEEWADLIANYVSGNISTDAYGSARTNWIDSVLNSFFEVPDDEP